MVLLEYAATSTIIKHHSRPSHVLSHRTLMVSVYDRQNLGHEWPVGGQFLWLWQSSSCSSSHKRANGTSAPGVIALPQPPPRLSPGVPPHSPQCAGRHSRPCGHSVDGEAVLHELLLWGCRHHLRLPVVVGALGETYN